MEQTGDRSSCLSKGSCRSPSFLPQKFIDFKNKIHKIGHNVRKIVARAKTVQSPDDTIFLHKGNSIFRKYIRFIVLSTNWSLKIYCILGSIGRNHYIDSLLLVGNTSTSSLSTTGYAIILQISHKVIMKIMQANLPYQVKCFPGSKAFIYSSDQALS